MNVELRRIEPRIEHVSCRAEPNADEPNRLDIRIEYVIATQNDRKKRNLVYPFYLRTEEEDEAAKNGQNGV